MNIQNKILHFLQENNLLNTQESFIVGFSGGQDSLCLLDTLKDLSQGYNFKIIAAHLNHNWRGEESKKEQRTAFEYCQANKIDFHTETLSLSGKKTEIEAREQRYKFFNKTALKYNSRVLFTAHTKTDNTETILYRIIKGTGVHGLQGIPTKRAEENYTIYRPMLNITREETEQYCKNKNLPIACDSSNFDDKYARNNLRMNIIPKLKEINPSFDDAIENLCDIAQDYEQITNNAKPLLELTPVEFCELPVAVQKITMHKFLMQNDINYDKKRIEEIIKFIKENTQKPCGKKISLTTNKWLFVSNKEFEIATKSKKTDIAKKLIIKEFKGELPEKFPDEKSPKILVNLPYKEEELELRYRQNGDTIQPFGMDGTMKLKKFFINKAIAEHKRDEIPLLAHGNEILWAKGVGISEKLRVTDKATHTIEIEEE